MSCSDENLETVMELGRYAQNIGADWIIVHAPPLYFHTNVDAVLKEYYRYIADQLDIGVAIWHQPDYNYILERKFAGIYQKLVILLQSSTVLIVRDMLV